MRISDWSSYVCSSDLDGDGIAGRLVRLPGAPLRMPNLSVHLYREIREDGFLPDPQRHAVPVLGLDAPGHLLTLVAAHAGVDADETGRAWLRERGCQYG